jgi:MinD superfamily P-loop ATPase
VIASLSGADSALVVTESTLSGLHDAKRVIEVAEHFKIPVKMVVNKYDLNNEMTDRIEQFCKDKGIALIGKIGFDRAVVESMVAGTTIVEHCGGSIKEEIVKIWEELKT